MFHSRVILDNNVYNYYIVLNFKEYEIYSLLSQIIIVIRTIVVCFYLKFHHYDIYLCVLDLPERYRHKCPFFFKLSETVSEKKKEKSKLCSRVRQ